MSDIEFVDGLIVKAPKDNAPDYVKASISIKRAELAAWLAARDGEWINVQVKESKGGKWYAAVDNWKPEGQRQDAPRGGGHGKPAPEPSQPQGDDFPEDDIPFATNRDIY